MDVRTFYLPNGNRIDIDDRGPNNTPNGILDRSDSIRINNHSYRLDRIGYLAADHPDRRAWEFLRRELGVSSLSGINLSRAHQIHVLREDARYRLTQSHPIPEQERVTQGFIDTSNELARLYGLPSVTRADLQSLNTLLSTPAEGRLWSPAECFLNGGMNYCSER